MRSSRSTSRNFAARSVSGRIFTRWYWWNTSAATVARTARAAASRLSPTCRTGVGRPRKMKIPLNNASRKRPSTISRLRSARRRSDLTYCATSRSALRSSISPTTFSDLRISGRMSSATPSCWNSQTMVASSSRFWAVWVNKVLRRSSQRAAGAISRRKPISS